MRRIQRQSLLFIVISVALTSCLSIVGGMALELTSHELLTIVPLLIALPALNTIVADYATIIAAHAGNPDERTITHRKLIRSVLKSTAINIIGTIAFSILLSINRGFDVSAEFVLVFSTFIALTILVSVGAMLFITHVLDKILEKHKLNPDDILLPVVATITNILVLTVVAVATKTIF